MNWDKLPVIGRDRDSFKLSSVVRFANDVKTSGNLPSIVLQSISSKRETHALPMQEVIALLGDCPCPLLHDPTGKH
jgi:hypothetical protein